jgi:FKBP-type peptidyl-prolyl cis-trans isomerase
MRYLHLFVCLLGLLATVAPLHAQREKFPTEDLAVVEKRWPNAKKTSTGLRYVIQEEGTGAPAAPGDLVSVNYRGLLLDGKVFDYAPKADKPEPFTFRLGRGQVIEGWDQGLQLMRLGTKITLIIPFELGYGTRGDLPEIPGRATLVFEVEMVKIERYVPIPSIMPAAPDPKAKKKK